MSKISIAMISSTLEDLPEYRPMVRDACLRTTVFPNMMEQLPALDKDAIEISLEMVDKSAIYIGIFAHKYGYIPKGHDISITEMEYNRAVERGIPKLIFIMSDEVPVKPKNIDQGEKGEKLQKLKEKFKKEKVVAFFEDPKDLRGLVIDSLETVKKELGEGSKDNQNQGKIWAKSLHNISEIPVKPRTFCSASLHITSDEGIDWKKTRTRDAYQLDYQTYWHFYF